jgi:hypothetical protein
MFLKVLEVPRNFFQEVSWWGAGVKPLPDKPQFDATVTSSNSI